MANLATIFFESITTSSLPGPVPLASARAKGCGYNGQADPMHTVQYTVNNGFAGTIKIQATLATEPTETDWFDVDNTTLTNEFIPVLDGATTVNFTGNFVWVRSIITAFTAGNINRVLYTHN
jgi:hypothetical protein